MSEQIPKGRGHLLEMLRRHKEAKAGGGEPQEAEPPKSRGRAIFLQKLHERQKKVGVSQESASSSTSSIQAPGSSLEKVTRGVSQLSVASTSITKPPSEPTTYQGQSGTPFRVTANYIRLEVEKDRGVYEYEVRFQPDVDARNYRIKLVNEALGTYKTTKVYDGDVCLYLPLQLYTERHQHNTVLPNTEEPVQITMIYKRKKRLAECIHLYNVLFKRIMHILLYNRMGRNYFSADHKQIVPQHKLEILPGFAISCDEMEGGLMLMLDTTHRVIRSQTVYDWLREMQSANPQNFKNEVRKNIIGTSVLTKYNNQTYIVDDIQWDKTPKDSFPTRDGGQCRFIDYYKHHHNIVIQDVDQPMLVNNQKRTVNGTKLETQLCLIPELSYMTGLTDAMRADYKVMKDVAIFTRVTPSQRALALRTYLERVNGSEQAREVLAGWGLKLAGGTTEVPARILPQENIYFGTTRGEERMFTGADWNRAVSENRLTGPIDITNWILFYTASDQKNAQAFAQTIVRLANSMGCIIRDPQMCRLPDDRTESYMTAIQNNVTSSTQVAVFICPTLRSDRYSIIKKMCCVNLPLASQVILSKTLKNPAKVRAIIYKIGMQIMCKLGGSLWYVKIPFSGWMVCGIDVYHGTNKQSVCGFVASINDSLSNYYSEATFQGGEIGDFFKVSFRRALAEYQKRNGCLPAKLVIFRDGVGDGQLEHSRAYEAKQFTEVMAEMQMDCTLTFVVVQKRINTRIFKMIDDRQYENPPSGTVVDTVITRRDWADFYLVPQSVRQGTVNPTHYIVIQDGGLKPDHVQRLAYKLCHLYYNWSGTIRVPAPCLYAHKIAALVGQYIKKTPAIILNDKLYYL